MTTWWPTSWTYGPSSCCAVGSGPALSLIDQGLGLARQLEEPQLTARLLAARAFALDVEGDHAGAARDAAESVLLYRQVGDRRQVGTMLGNLGYVELSTGELDAARGHLLESLDIARALNDRYGVVYGTFNLGLAEYLSGSLGAAADLFAESLDLAARMRMRASIGYALIGLAMAGSGSAGMARSARLHGAAEEALAVWARPSSRWRASCAIATASACVPPWAPRRSRRSTPPGEP